METKFCPRCKETKPHDDFYRSRDRQDGRAGWCKVCQIESNKPWQKKNPEKIQRYHRKCKLRTNHHITPEEYQKKAEEQKYLCGLCGQPETTLSCVGRSGKHLAVDHDHKTGKNRALLCHSCNTGLGAFNDSSELLQRAIGYLKKYSESIK